MLLQDTFIGGSLQLPTTPSDAVAPVADGMPGLFIGLVVAFVVAFILFLPRFLSLSPLLFDSLFRARGSILMERCSEYDPFHEGAALPEGERPEQRSIRDLFTDFYARRSGGDLPDTADEQLLAYVEELVQQADLHSPPHEEEIQKILAFMAQQEVDA